jgi:ATP synthase protein I
MAKHDDRFPKQVSKREKRKLDAQKEHKKIWFGLGMFGVVGWSIALPTVLGGFLGIWIDSHWQSRYSWTLMLIIFGLFFGCFTAWNWVQKERQDLTAKKNRGTKDNA